MTAKEIIERCYGIYKPGIYYYNAYHKYNPKENLNYVYAKINNPIFEVYHKPISSFKLAIIDTDSRGGALYIDGYWADICDEKGNILYVVDENYITETELDIIRKIIYNE